MKEILESGEYYHRRYNNVATIIVWPILLLLIFLVTFSFYAKKDLTINSNGVLIQKYEVVSFVSPNEVTKLHKNQKGRFSVIGNENLKDTINCKISSISKHPIKNNGNLSYKIIYKLTPTKKEHKFLVMGVQGQITNLYKRESYFNYYKDSLSH